VDAATVGYTYLHYPVVTGIILTATGIDLTMQAVASSAPLGWFGAAALAGGVSLYQASTAIFWWRLTGTWLVPRLGVAMALLPGIALAAALPAMAAIAIAVALGIGLNIVESRMLPKKEPTATTTASPAPLPAP